MPTVPMSIVKTRNAPLAGKLMATHLQVMEDQKVEKLPRRVHAFGRALPLEMRFVPPQNRRLAERWLDCQNIPKDLESMDVVWKDIMHLDSVKSFVDYLNDFEQVTIFDYWTIVD